MPVWLGFCMCFKLGERRVRWGPGMISHNTDESTHKVMYLGDDDAV